MILRYAYSWRYLIHIRGCVSYSTGHVNTHCVHTTTEPWDAILNQTDISGNQNKNKFYIIQLLKSITDPDPYTLYTRWGRVGEIGRLDQITTDCPLYAERLFDKKFKSKTGVEWIERETVAPKTGKYIWLDRHYDEEENNFQAAVIPPSILEPEVLTLCNLIFSEDQLSAHLAAMNYNAAKIPLGKPFPGPSAQSIADVIDNPTGPAAQEHGGADAAYAALNSVYYSVIPHVSGRAALPLDLMDSLLDMEVASKIIGGDNGSIGRAPMHPTDAQFASLGLSHIAPVDHAGPEYTAIAEYARDTEVRRSHFRFDIQKLNSNYPHHRAVETAAWTNAGHDQLDDGEWLLLWHGSRSTNFAGILKDGLRIAPPQAPSSGYMFGRGVYFADSFNYCHSYLSNDTGLLLLCEVAARPLYEQKDAADLDCAKVRKRSTKGLGRSAPAHWTDAGAVLLNEELRGCMMPVGYIVYNLNQIRLRYVVMVQTRSKS
ncbi:poly polymerase catalytic domain-containing protein [Mycena galopus ATCC 62051]|nr:poly polymerase catalytic domain-containing protein [Mycena galopus ATCC 62051]